MTERVVSLSRFQADLSQSLAKRGKHLLESDQLAKEMASLEPLEAYFIIKELGVDDAGPLLRHATREQLQTFVDLDCWNDDHPDDVEIDAWLAPFAAQGPQALAEAFLKLDEELQVWFLRNSLYIWEPEEAESEPEPIRGLVRRTTDDGFFVIQHRSDTLREVDPMLVVSALYSVDLQEAFRLMTAARWELNSPLEEQAFQFRSARVESLGFPQRSEAMALFTPPPTAPRPPVLPKLTQRTPIPALYAAPLSEGSLLTRALEQVKNDDRLAFYEERLRNVINRAVVAYGRTPRDVRQAASIAERVRDVISLGLEHLLSPDEPLASPNDLGHGAAAAALLEQWDLADVFRHGHALVAPLRERALQIVADPVVAHELNRPETESEDYGPDRMDREFLRALADMPPTYAGWDTLQPSNRRAFANKREIEDAAQRLEAIAQKMG